MIADGSAYYVHLEIISVLRFKLLTLELSDEYI